MIQLIARGVFRRADCDASEVMSVIAEAAEWLALQRAHEGVVATLNGCYVNHGRPVTAALAAAFDDLIATGLLTLSQPDQRRRHQVSVTQTGQARCAALRNGQRPPGAQD